MPKIQVDDELAAMQRAKNLFIEIPLKSRQRVLDYLLGWSEEWKNGEEPPAAAPDQSEIFPS